MLPMLFPLFTSIKPPKSADELSYLRDCLKSWRAAGFDPVAVNGPSEIKALHGLDLRVEFATLPTDGKPRIGAILDVIRESGASFAGIINSDCRINSDCIFDYNQFAYTLPPVLAGRVVQAWRTDIDGEKATACPYGFDAFFFDTKIMPGNDFQFSIGEACWDYWFPMACEAKGATVETLDMPLIMHKVHSQKWSWQEWEDNCRRLWKWTGRSGDPSLADLHEFTASIWIRYHTRLVTVKITGMPDNESMLNSIGRSMLEAADGRISHASVLITKGTALTNHSITEAHTYDMTQAMPGDIIRAHDQRAPDIDLILEVTGPVAHGKFGEVTITCRPFGDYPWHRERPGAPKSFPGCYVFHRLMPN